MTLATLLAFVAVTAMPASQKAPEVTVSSGPSIQLSNTNYAGNRKPLVGTPFIKLPVGAVKPKGWLLKCLELQRDGLMGHLGEISAWLDKSDNAWLNKDGKGKWGWEEVPYWLKGYANVGYILNDKKMLAESKIWLEGVLKSQRADGNFGPTFTDDKGAEDFWPKMIMLYSLQSYYEYSNDKRVLDFMARFFRYQEAYPEDKFMQMYWQSRRVGDNLHSVLWLYNITGEDWLLQLAEKIHRKGMDWTPRKVDAKDWFKSLGDWHNVNHAQGFREMGQYYQLSGDKQDLKNTYDSFWKIREFFGQVPGGMFGSDENARPGYTDPRQAVETCGMVEQMNSDQELLRISGDIFWADHAEDVAFNTYPAAVMPDFKSLRYLTAPNMVLNDDKNHAPGIANSGPFLMMNPFSSRCCQHNHAQGWPYYVENLWQATSDNGVAAVLYTASEASVKVSKGVPVKLTMKGNYPFDEKLEFTVKPSKSVAFPLYLRIPAWCKAPVLSVNGKAVPVKNASGKYIKIARTWKDGDRVTLKLPMTLSLRTWTKNKNSVSVNYGPLTYSLKIGESYIKTESTTTAVHDSKWQPGADAKKWPSYQIHPTTPWNYGLIIGKTDPLNGFKVVKKGWPKSDFPFTLETCPIEIKAVGRRILEWKIDQYGLCGVLPQSPVSTTELAEYITLVPMGAARLRISAFPVVK